MDLNSILKPYSVAIVDASDNSSTIGGRLFRALVNHGYRGKIFPINSNHEEVGGIKCYSNLSDINSEIDTILIAVEGKEATRAIEGSGKKKIKSAIIYSSSSIRLGEATRLENERIVGLAKKYN